MRILGLAVCLFAISVAGSAYLLQPSLARRKHRLNEVVHTAHAQEAEATPGVIGALDESRPLRWQELRPRSVPQFLEPNIETEENLAEEASGEVVDHERDDLDDKSLAVLDVCVFSSEGVPLANFDVFLRADRDGHTWAERTDERACAHFSDLPPGQLTVAVIRGFDNSGRAFLVEPGHNELFIIDSDEDGDRDQDDG